MNELEKLENDIVAWVELERERFSTSAARLRIPARVPERRPKGMIDANDYCSIDYDLVTVNSASIFRLFWEIDQHGGAPRVPPALITEVMKAFPSARELWRISAPKRIEGMSDDFWVGAELRGIRDRYLEELESFDHGNPALARELARESLAFLGSDSVRYRVWLPIAGFEANESIDVDNVRLRALSEEELGDIGEFVSEFPSFRSPRKLFRIPRRLVERHALEVRVACSKSGYPHDDYLLQRLIIGLQLLGFEPHGQGIAGAEMERRQRAQYIGQEVRLPEAGARKTITSAELSRALELARKMSGSTPIDPRDIKQVAIHRFHVGCAEENPGDALVDFVIALEALLLQGVKEGELRFRFSLFGANLLDGQLDERQENYKRLQELYDLRSQVVHGNKPPSKEDTVAGARRARELSARMLLVALERGWPTQVEMIRAALSTEAQIAVRGAAK